MNEEPYFPSHQHGRRPLVSITLHPLRALIQIHGSQLRLIAGKLHGAQIAVSVYVEGKSR